MASPRESEGYRRGPLARVFPSPSRPASWRRAAGADGGYGVSDRPDWREIDWPAHRHQVQIAGRSVHYVDLGQSDATPVVLVHGLGGCWQNWLENLPRVALQRRVIALDLPGFGSSELPVAPISITNFAATVDALCEILDLGPVALVGNSMGGFTSAEIAIRHPERVERLVLVDAAGISITRAFDKVTMQAAKVISPPVAADPEAIKRIFSRPAFIQAAFGTVMRHPTRLPRDVLAEQIHGTGKPAFIPAMQALMTYDFADQLGGISCPTLVVHGSEDFLVPLGDAFEFERRIPRSTTLILEDTGHVPMIERPRRFNDALLEFLEQTGAPDEPGAETEPTPSEARSHPV
jgi:pimeloyl-ACP methyl ester carboxylesterase